MTESAVQLKRLPDMQLLTPVAEMQYELLFRHAVVFATQRAGVKVMWHSSVAALQVIAPQKKVPMHDGPDEPPPEPPPLEALPPPDPPPEPMLQLENSRLPSPRRGIASSSRA